MTDNMMVVENEGQITLKEAWSHETKKYYKFRITTILGTVNVTLDEEAFFQLLKSMRDNGCGDTVVKHESYEVDECPSP